MVSKRFTRHDEVIPDLVVNRLPCFDTFALPISAYCHTVFPFRLNTESVL